VNHYHIVKLTIAIKSSCEFNVTYLSKWHTTVSVNIENGLLCLIHWKSFERWNAVQIDVWRKQQHEWYDY